MIEGNVRTREGNVRTCGMKGTCGEGKSDDHCFTLRVEKLQQFRLCTSSRVNFESARICGTAVELEKKTGNPGLFHLHTCRPTLYL